MSSIEKSAAGDHGQGGQFLEQLTAVLQSYVMQ
jgi:hypothetical protein